LGEFATLDKLVFGAYRTKIISENDVKGLNRWIGLDFGYINDPSAIVWGYIDTKKRKIYVTGEYVRKGMKLYVEGKLQTRTWEKDGQVRRKTEIIAENIQVLYRPAEYRNEAVSNEFAEATEDGAPSIPTLEVEDIF
jgi:hypothetical protein